MEIIPFNKFHELAYLIGFHLTVYILQIDQFFDILVHENMMAAVDARKAKTEPLNEQNKIAKGDVLGA